MTSSTTLETATIKPDDHVLQLQFKKAGCKFGHVKPASFLQGVKMDRIITQCFKHPLPHQASDGFLVPWPSFCRLRCARDTGRSQFFTYVFGRFDQFRALADQGMATSRQG